MHHISYKELKVDDYKVFLAQKLKYLKKQSRYQVYTKEQQQRIQSKISLIMQELRRQ